MEQKPLLEIKNIGKTFGSIKSLTDICLNFNSGEIHSLMGENGAGKSTLIKILSGAYTADNGGEILINDKQLILGNPKISKDNGISVIYQELALAPNLSIAQNVYLGQTLNSFGLINNKILNEKAKIVLEMLDINHNPNVLVSELSLAEKQMIEIAKSLAVDAKIIVMDEPTTSLSQKESEKLFEIVYRLKKSGIAIIYISHRMEEVYLLSDKVSVLRNGKYVGTLNKREISANKIVSMMIGRSADDFYIKDNRLRNKNLILKIENISDNDKNKQTQKVKNCSFYLNKGEILAISGLSGSGRTELARIICGIDKKSSGKVILENKEIKINNPQDAINNGIMYLTEDRKLLGLFLDMTISENININTLVRDSFLNFILDLKKIKNRSKKAINNLTIKTESELNTPSELSGGNQQKVLLARLIENNPKILILDEPTRGVDVGAKSEIYKIINNLVKKNMSVIIISSDLQEIIGISDRILVIREGEIVGEILNNIDAKIIKEKIISLSTESSK